MTTGYSRLPGRRRGILRGASVWLGSDHLLAVRSTRFRENYKRFYFRDIQAIAVARAPRHHLSVRAIAIALVLFWTWALVRSFWPMADQVFFTTLGLLALIWLQVSTRYSCRCRIYTAVSQEELPSIYRTWTARRFLAKVEPLIAAAQPPADPNQAVPAPDPAPAPPAHVPDAAPLPQAAESPAPAPLAAPTPEISNTAAYLFLAILLLDAAITPMPQLPAWAWPVISTARVATALWIIILRHRKQEREGMRRVAIASMVAAGLLLYVQQTAASVAGSMDRVRPIVNTIDMGISITLAILGLAIVLRSRR